MKIIELKHYTINNGGGTKLNKKLLSIVMVLTIIMTGIMPFMAYADEEATTNTQETTTQAEEETTAPNNETTTAPQTEE